jgi:hypothetical protein
MDVSQARRDGYRAYMDGLKTVDNPYDSWAEEELWQAWLEGWHDAAWDDCFFLVDMPGKRVILLTYTAQQGKQMTDLNNAYVRVLNGKTGTGTQITNTVFRLLGHLGRNEQGTFITVDGNGHEGLRNGKARIYLSATDYEMIDPTNGARLAASSPDAADVDERTDDEISKDLSETFEILADMTNAVAHGVVKGLVVSGPAGIGKSHTVEVTLDHTLGLMARVQGVEPSYDIIKGNSSALNLYCLLYRYSAEGSVVVLDDIDSALYDEDCLNLLKAVLDTKKSRRVHWGTNSHILEKEGVPSSFEFKGGVIFLTNIKFDQNRSQRIANHLQAIMSRVHYLDIRIDTLRERVIHLTNTARNTDMLEEYDFTPAEIDQLMDWLISNVNRLHTVDLRMVIKAADLMKATPRNWQKMAQRSLLKAGRAAA